ncbi:Rieske 2Fe-2S domain-containing protein [Deinococcus maricopensis]|uniref:Rieske (2Fe-2S) iron-sulfur domain protein n=1 Tax=Deinococcus maricopensis (strain DSM 21211 / LMG 22137 / NRRL B-23946 / LB-34) TaxID=709986 RepID=E8U6P9_DEIML|nr:Rieske 2Fe-2S domain-containing protein [Deinococcus maricopensis]ADV66738.1 Rieske (2Fe-2S) iron-sulfur domain protein [Deinococcus maricopensis DSM 21211]
MTKFKRVDPEISRRKFINIALGTTAAVGGVSLITALGSVRPVNRITPGKLPAIPGDILVYADGDKAGQPIQDADLGIKATRAWPQGKDKDGKPLVKSEEPNNLLLVFKFAESDLKAPTDLKGVVDGVVAYSAICQHLGCQVGDNNEVPGTLLCPCHSGAYDPKQGCKVIGGPPPRPLPQLPIKQEGGQYIAAGPLEFAYFGTTDTDFEKLVKEAEGT